MNEYYCNLPVTTASYSAARAIYGFADELLSHGAGARIIFDAVAADPECALAHAYAAALYLTQLTRAGQRQAAPHITAASRLTRQCSEREATTIAAVAAWGRGDDKRAITLLREVVQCAPYDLVAAKLCQILELGVGDIGGMLRSSAMAAAVEDRSGYALGLHAFALEQAGHPAVALRFARRALDCHPERDPWAQHANAHALLALDRPLEARTFLQNTAPTWDRCSSFMLTHNWWHLALIELDLGNQAGALDIFDKHVWGVRKGHVQDQINAISLLARLEMHGSAAAGRWDDILAHLESRITDRMSDFVDLHYLLALNGSAQDSQATTLAHALQGHPVAGALARSLMSYAARDYHAAAAAIAPVRGNLSGIGGSNIQRELFEAIYVDSIARAQEAIHRVAA